MTAVQVICLGNRHAGDDGAALQAVDALAGSNLMRVGRPGAALLDLLEVHNPVVLVDVTQSGSPPGTIHRIAMADLADATVAGPNISSHGFGPAQTLQLGRVLGRRLPKGMFIGLEGAHFEPGDSLSLDVQAAIPAFVAAIREAIDTLSGSPNA